jgi:hypothetical protein
MASRGKVFILLVVVIGGAFSLSPFIGNPFVPLFTGNNTLENNLPRCFDLANDNEHIAWIGTSEIVIYNYISNEEITTFRTKLSYTKDIAWSPDSSKIAVAGFISPNENPARIEVYDLINLDLIFEEDFYFEDDYQKTGQSPFLTWSADGKYLFGEILHSQMEFESDAYTEDSYEKHILWDTESWETVWAYNIPIYNGHSHAFITDTADRIFYRSGDGNGSVSISMIDPISTVITEFNFFENRNTSSDLYINDILWGNDTTIIFMAEEYSNYLSSELFYAYNFQSGDLILLYNTSSNINEPIMNFDGTLVMDYYSDQFNPIHSLLIQEVVYTIEHPFQELYGGTCLDMGGYPCAVSVPHQWSTFSNLIAYANYYEDTKDYVLVIFDVDKSEILGIIPKL